VATFRFDNFRPYEFTGTVIFRVGPSNISVETPETRLDGIRGLGLLGGTGVPGLGGHAMSADASGVGVLGIGGQPESSNPAQGGVGVQGIAGGTLGAPASGSHQVGEFFVDSAGDLFFCKVGGVRAAAKWVKLA